MTQSPPEVADPEGVRETILELTGLSDDRFAQALAECIMDPIPDEVAAFRSPDLIVRSVAASQFLIDHANTMMRTRAGADASNRDLQRRTEMFRAKVGRERLILRQVLAGIKAQNGILDTAPNPRSRAARRLKQRHLAEYQELVREETANIAEERREARRQAKLAAKERKRAEAAGRR